MSQKPSPRIQPAAGEGRYLTFTLGDESYGLPVLNVREIIRLCPITPVPRMPTHVKGVINLRGTVIAVLDLRAKFQLAAKSYGERTCIIVVQVAAPSGGSTLMGAVVDAVEEVVQLTADDIEATPDFGGAPETQYILGLATIQGGVKILLNIEKIFLEDGTPLIAASAKTGPINSTRKRMTMNNWTISRRVIAGFAVMLLIIIALGVFALWRLTGLAQNVADLADRSSPSVLLLNEASKVSRGNLIDLLQIDATGSSERNAALEQRIAANTVRRDELLKSYEDRGLIADDEDRRLFQDVQRAKEIMTASRTRAIELAREGKADESRQLQQQAVIPDYEKYLKAIDLTVDYKAKLGQSTADAGKASALFSRRLIGLALGLASLLAFLLAWQVIRSTNRALKDITVNLDRGALQTASAARQVSMAKSKPRFRGQ